MKKLFEITIKKLLFILLVLVSFSFFALASPQYADGEPFFQTEDSAIRQMTLGSITNYKIYLSNPNDDDLSVTWYVDGQITPPKILMIEEDIQFNKFLKTFSTIKNDTVIYFSFYSNYMNVNHEDSSMVSYHDFPNKKKLDEALQDIQNKFNPEMFIFEGQTVFYIKGQTKTLYWVDTEENLILINGYDYREINDIRRAYINRFPSLSDSNNIREKSFPYSSDTPGKHQIKVEVSNGKKTQSYTWDIIVSSASMKNSNLTQNNTSDLKIGNDEKMVNSLRNNQLGESISKNNLHLTSSNSTKEVTISNSDIEKDDSDSTRKIIPLDSTQKIRSNTHLIVLVIFIMILIILILLLSFILITKKY